MQSSKGHLLITGAAGFIGSNFVELVARAGYAVTVLDAMTYAGHRANLENAIKTGHCDLVVGEIQNRDLVDSLFQRVQFSGVLNFAAESHVDNSITGPKSFIETNVVGTFTLLESAKQHWLRMPELMRQKFRFLHVSTDEVYGSLGETGKFSETTSYAPNSPYSASKAASDHLVRAWFHTYGLPTITTNCSNNYGPRQFPEKLIPRMILQALKEESLPVYGTGTNIRDWIHVEDHCAGLLAAFEKGTPGSTYCFGGNSERNNLQVVKTICAVLDEMVPRKDGQKHEVGIQFVKDRLGHDFRYAIDDQKAVRELGFHRKYANFEAGLVQTVKWYLDNFEWMEKVLHNERKHS